VGAVGASHPRRRRGPASAAPAGGPLCLALGARRERGEPL